MTIKRIIIVPYKYGSVSARKLQGALKAKTNIPVLRVPTTSTKYQPRWTDYVINWGCSVEWPWINMTEKQGNANAVNKLHFFEKIKAHNQVFANLAVNVPEWTTDMPIANQWIADKKAVFGRKILNGHSGAGIVEFVDEPITAAKACPLYVQYKKKRHEYRVHLMQTQVGKWEIIDVTQKKKRKGYVGPDTKIRNHKNGWVYCREAIAEPADLRTQATNAAFASDLPFCAVDLIWNEKENKCYVLEVNTAPGIDGTTLNNYANAFIKEVGHNV